MATNEQLELMRQVPLFSEVGKRDLKRWADDALRRAYQAGDEIVEEGTRGVGMFVILEGQVVVTRQGAQVAELGPGTYFGDLALFEDVPRTATVSAKTATTCLAFTRWDFLAELRSEPTMALQMLTTTMRRLRETTEELAALKGEETVD